MLRKEIMTAEMQKIAQDLARIFGLKIDGLVLEADEAIGESLQEDFDLELDDLENFMSVEFEEYLRKHKFSKEKIEVLSQLLYAKIDSFEPTNQNKDIAERLLQLYDFIEVVHNTSSFEILNRKVKVKQLLNS
ncbi:uncharacterized protein YfkK (UPF0435 family) [Pedobacter sp. UYP30]|uniref:hypothetical protein n=1 Tax=Pedobacter sp. UYP30 TaxID=1756400 RepID=UPI003399F568